MFINRPLRERLNQYANALSATFNKTNPTAIKFDIEKVLAVLDVDRMLRVPFCFPSPAMNLDLAVTYMIANISINPWAPITDSWIRQGTLLHVTRIVHDVTTAATQVGLGSSFNWSDCAPVTLPTTAGLAENVDIWVPPGFYLGLHATDNIGDASRDMTVYGEYVQLGVNGFDFGGTFYGLYPQ